MFWRPSLLFLFSKCLLRVFTLPTFIRTTFLFFSLYYKRNGLKLVVLKKILLNFFSYSVFSSYSFPPTHSKAFSTFLPTQFNLSAPKSLTTHRSVVGACVNGHLLLEEAPLVGTEGCTDQWVPDMSLGVIYSYFPLASHSNLILS